jgi:hypothetical protein
MSFNWRALPAALLLSVSACGADDVGIENGCYGNGCADLDSGYDATLAPCPSGTVLADDYECVSELTGDSPVGAVTPATWAAAEETCASGAASTSIVTTPCDGMVAYQPAETVPAAQQLQFVVYDTATGQPVAVIGPPALGFPGYTYFSGEVTITAGCLITLTTGVSCRDFDAAVSDGSSE